MHHYANWTPWPNSLLISTYSFITNRWHALKFRIQRETFVIGHATVPLNTGTSTTFIQMYDDVGSTSVSHVHINTFQRQIQDPISTLRASPLIDRHESPVTSHMQFAKPIAPADLEPNIEPAASYRPNLDIMFDRYETNSVKSTVLAIIKGSAENNFMHSPNESLDISYIDTSPHLENLRSDYLPARVENRITAWLHNVVEDTIECHDHG